MAAVKFEVFLGPDGKYMFRLFGKDGSITAKSKGFQNKDDAMLGIQAVKEICLGTDCYQKKTLDAGKFGFVLVRPNRQVVLEGGPYENQEAYNVAMTSVRMSNEAVIFDLS